MPRKTKRKVRRKKDDMNSKTPPSENNEQTNNGQNNNTSATSATPRKNSTADQTHFNTMELNNTKHKVNQNLPTALNANIINENSTQNLNELMIKEVVDPHINRLFDHIRYSEEAVSALPNRSWAIHCTDIPVKRIVISEMVMHNAHASGLEPFYVKQIVLDEKLNFELFLLNSRTLLKDKPSCVRCMEDFESVLDYVDSIKLCHGGPDISEYNNIHPECAYKDPYNKWRHNLCLLEIQDCDVCESCVSLEEILKRHAQRKSPLKSRNHNVVKRKRTYL